MAWISATTLDDRNANFQFHARLLQAHRLFEDGERDGAVAAMRELLAECRASGYFGFLRLPADTHEIECSLDRPPKTTATRGLRRGEFIPPDPIVRRRPSLATCVPPPPPSTPADPPTSPTSR